jgi:murein DD-endopeptidase MepM/ murein hydrolase activator NlpD
MSRYYDLLKEFGYRETQGFGRTPFAISRPILYPDRFHDGRDYTYSSPKNNACKVMFDGKVTYVGVGGKYGRDYGNIVEIEVSPNTFMVYAHLDRFLPLAKVGDIRKVGDDIGIIGKSGTSKSTGIHVHLLLRQLRQKVDPKLWIDTNYKEDKPNNNEDMETKEIRAIVEGIYWSFAMRQPDKQGVLYWISEYSKEPEKAKWLSRILEGLRSEKTNQKPEPLRFLDAKTNVWRTEKDVLASK